MAATNAMLGLVNRLESRVFVVWFGRQAGRLVQSSFRIVPVATASTTDAPTALRSSTVKVSSGSRLRSVLTVIVIVWLQTPGGKVRVPLAALESDFASPVPATAR